MNPPLPTIGAASSGARGLQAAPSLSAWRPAPFALLPADLPSYHRKFPILDIAEADTAADNCLDFLIRVDAGSEVVEAAGQFLQNEWKAGLAAARFWSENHPAGSAPLEQAVAEARAAYQRRMEEIKLPFTVATLAMRDVTSEQLPLVWDEIVEELPETSQVGLTTNRHEFAKAHAAKIAVSLMQASMLMVAFGFDPLRSAASLAVSLLLAYCLSEVYQIIARSVVECWSELTKVSPDPRLGERLLPIGLKVEAALFAAGFATIATCGMVLDATFIVQTSARDFLGNPSPQAIHYPVALAMATVFSGLLALYSLAVARHDRAKNDMLRCARGRVKEAEAALAECKQTLHEREDTLARYREGEAQTFATFDGVWQRILYICALAQRKAPAETIIHLAYGIPAASACAVPEPSTTRMGSLSDRRYAEAED